MRRGGGSDFSEPGSERGCTLLDGLPTCKISPILARHGPKTNFETRNGSQEGAENVPVEGVEVSKLRDTAYR